MAWETEDAIEIEASPQRVWEVLADTAAYPQWNPFIEWRAGDLTPGAKVRIYVKPWGNGTEFTATLLKADPGRELAWKGSAPIPGLVDGLHYFRIEPLGENRCRHLHGEVFSGLLVPLLKGKLERELKPQYSTFNRALKARVEGAHR